MKLIHATPHLALYAAAMLIAAMAAVGPIAQPADYHHFADQRSLFGIPNAGDVLSNIGFLLVAAYGAALYARSSRTDPAYAVFFAALAMTAAGSAWYHLAPDDARLVWDRVPIALACGALLSAALRDAYPRIRLALPMLSAFAVLSVFWWVYSGDLRPYLLVQAAPLVLIPILQVQSGAPVAQRRAFGIAIGLYVLAKLCEVGDQMGFEAVGVISGHTLKHVFAATAAFVLAREFGGRR